MMVDTSPWPPCLSHNPGLPGHPHHHGCPGYPHHPNHYDHLGQWLVSTNTVVVSHCFNFNPTQCNELMSLAVMLVLCQQSHVAYQLFSFSDPPYKPSWPRFILRSVQQIRNREICKHVPKVSGHMEGQEAHYNRPTLIRALCLPK